ncbi:hypothetical protein LV469_08710 [Peptoniphilus sp. GNH]|nr:hypothetical protein HMPREF3189_01497 [Clostridiales bacterium KA00134]UHR02702.1 hypothetical protein LV469_08710 [Peptoniphilus sp. GNH]
MKFVFTEKALSYLKAKNVEEITITTYHGRTCCAAPIAEPVINLGAPAAWDDLFLSFELDEPKIKIHLTKLLDFKDNTVILDLEKYLMFENLCAKNLDVKDLV